jgi:hypothetical protein
MYICIYIASEEISLPERIDEGAVAKVLDLWPMGRLRSVWENVA